MRVVEVALVIVGEDLVGLFGRLEADFGFFALLDGDLVGVVGECCLCSFVRTQDSVGTQDLMVG